MKNVILLLSLMVLLSCAMHKTDKPEYITDSYGAVVKRADVGKTIYLIFSADSMFEGADTILKVLKKHDIKGSFFLTGNCLRLQEHEKTIKRLIAESHYVGGHSDGHILYADWDKNRRNLVTDDSLKLDLDANYVELARFGITKEAAPYFLPPYEWYNKQNIQAIKDYGIIPVNFTPRTYTPDDYTTPDMSNYKSSQELLSKLMEYEHENTLNGAVILIHPGTSPKRTDKLYYHLDGIIETLKSKGYKFDKL